jgi:hypothetical protein
MISSRFRFEKKSDKCFFGSHVFVYKIIVHKIDFEIDLEKELVAK